MSGLDDLARLTDMVYQGELQRLQRITQAEQRLRGTIDELDAQAEDGFVGRLDRPVPLNLAAAQDRAWRDWISVRRGQLQRELATILADKADHMARLTRSLGRRDVAARLAEAESARRRAGRDARQMAELQQLGLLRPRE